MTSHSARKVSAILIEVGEWQIRHGAKSGWKEEVTRQAMMVGVSLDLLGSLQDEGMGDEG
jgi:hypothetical protein